jgi:chemotaxis protein MotB
VSQPKNNPRTLPRIQRREKQHLDEGDSHLWAVSYADMLMVLLAFFIIFFSFENTSQPQKNFSQIALGFKTAGFGYQNSSISDPKETQHEAHREIQIINRHLASLESFNVQANKQSLQLHLPENIFSVGQYQLNRDLRHKLDEIHEVLKPFERDIEVIVVGHSDSMPFAQPHNEYLGDNFDLSSLRALRTVQYLLAQGFPREQISAQGAADGLRNSRTLSLKVSWKEAQP